MHDTDSNIQSQLVKRLRSIFDRTLELDLPEIGKSVTALRLAEFNGYRYIKITNWKGIRYYVNIHIGKRVVKVGWVALDGSDFSIDRDYDWKMYGIEAKEIVNALAQRMGYSSGV